MNKLIIIVGFLIATIASTEASSIIKTSVQDFNAEDGWDYVYEIKTKAFEKVQLDCQGFVSGMSFYQNDAFASKVYIDNYECGEVAKYFIDSKAEGLPICLELDTSSNALMLSHEMDDCL